VKTPTVTVTATSSAPGSQPVTIANVATRGGWALLITRTDDRYAAILAGPKQSDGIEVRLWRSLPDVMETLGGFLRRRGLEDVWAELRAGIDPEARS
jgi:hypothetical protein